MLKRHGHLNISIVALMAMAASCNNIESTHPPDEDQARETTRTGSAITRGDAIAMVQGFYRTYGVELSDLDDGDDVAGLMVGDAQLYFQYLPQQSALECSALVHKFREHPKPEVLESFKEEEVTVETGDGVVRYEPDNMGLYLSRRYTRSVSDAEFREDMNRLTDASKIWSTEVVGKVLGGK